MAIREDSVRACSSSDTSASALSPLSTLFSVVCVDMEDCRRAFDISSAWTLRASNVSRWSSLEVSCRLVRASPFARRARRGVKVSGGGGGLYTIPEPLSLSLSASASSALLGYSGGRSDGSSMSSTGRCHGGEV